MWSQPPICLDTNIAIYAFTNAGDRAATARAVLQRADFVSVQLLNEFANVALRKQGRSWPDVRTALDRLRRMIPKILPLDDEIHVEAMRIAERYRLSVYDALMLASAKIGGARTFYSEDLQHGMIIDETLRVVDPFTPGALDS